MLPDDLGWRIALDPLSARIPTRYTTGRIKHIERIVSHTADEQSEVALAVLERPMRPLPLRHVAGDFSKADQDAVFINRIDYHGCEKKSAALATPPPLRLESSLAQRRCEGLGGQARGAVLWRIEKAEMLADDFVGGVAFDPLG